ncbi:conserved membrane protein of unknown function [Rhodovastum atsumiense]|uniref:DUF2189 domain-containing protein n=1 Tax=Rhodovastum atsumiense TaxID=504468 RepID=A0A5M6IJ68_9PROT|nr:DUF2189 domain-containing protein [Rhodovastum atsumiense]KAA5608316.1 DUF2189 domain-containing protein [Rhodovastum atsumiense]CAH2605069.1 conserved membrane protein of unknown function [Rhodovastum atsumiense]
MTSDSAFARPLPVTGRPAIRTLTFADLRLALRRGWDDFTANPTHVIFLCAIYPVAGLLLGRMALEDPLLPLIYPLVAGFALVGPVAALGVYELSRRREQGRESTWRDAFGVVRSRNIGGILLLGAVLMAIMVVWLEVAQGLWNATVGAATARSVLDLPGIAFGSAQGWMLLLLGNVAGFLFAAVVLALTVVSFPLLLDRDIPGGAGAQASVAVQTSIAAVRANPVTMAGWGLIVAALLVIGSIPFLVGLAVVLPVLGHATWHLYRRAVES